MENVIYDKEPLSFSFIHAWCYVGTVSIDNLVSYRKDNGTNLFLLLSLNACSLTQTPISVP